MNDIQPNTRDSCLTVIVLTYNEELHIERCLKNALRITRQVFVVDSFSTDRTVAIAESYGARVWQHVFKNHATQLAWALENLPLYTEWVMRMDADEVISSILVNNILNELPIASVKTNGFLVSRNIRFQGKLIRHGGYPQWQLRIWRKGYAEIEQRWMDEHIIIESGNVVHLKGQYVDENLNNITWWTNKHVGYATREAIDLLNNKYHFLKPTFGSGELALQARCKRWIKVHLYVHLPLGLRAFLYFFYRMIFRLGILDGPGGFVFHFLQGFWYRFLVDVKVGEVERRMHGDGIDCVEGIRREFGVNPLA